MSHATNRERSGRGTPASARRSPLAPNLAPSGIVPRGCRGAGGHGGRSFLPLRRRVFLPEVFRRDGASRKPRRRTIVDPTIPAMRAVLCGLALLALPPFGLTPAAETGVRLDGPRTQGGLLRGRVPPGSAVELEGEPVRVSEGGWFLVGFGRDAPPEAELVAIFPDGRRERQVLAVERREYRIQRIDGLPPGKVTPRSEEDLARIRADVEMVKQARTTDDPRTDFLGGFRWPIKGRISGVYGSQRILNGEPRRPHFGIDIAAPAGTRVVAPADGTVTLVHPDMFFSGGTMIIDHGHGLSSAFLHLSRILVEKGERVAQGQLIAEVGSTGRSTGPHLDWRINLFARRLDPALLVGPMPK